MAIKPKYDLFISYAETDEDDRKWVEGYLIPALGLAEKRIITQKAFRLGASVMEEFNRAIITSRYTVLILSPSYLADKWSTFSEQLVSFASIVNQRERLVPLLRKPCNLPLRIDFRVRLDCTDQQNWEQEIVRLRDMLGQSEPERETIPCPYPGMVPFSEKDTRYFFGRESDVETLIRRLRHQNYLFIIGPSGSGKSSLIYAGLIPEVQKRHPDQWLVKSIRPGANPVQALLDEFDNPSLEDFNSSERCIELVETILGHSPPRQRLLLIIDQFEELFVQAPKSEQGTFIRLLGSLRRVRKCSLLLLMRADFYPDLMDSLVWPMTPSERLEITSLRGTNLRKAIVKPAETLGVYLEGELLERLLADAADEPGVLPLLQETMALLWEKMERRLLTLKNYEEIGEDKLSGLAVALAAKADAALAQLAEPQRAIARRIFLRLIHFGEGRADTRRQQSVSVLRSKDDDPLLFDQTLHHLTVNRLLTLSSEEGSHNRSVDISHEALITSWPTLQEWILKRREAEQTRRQLEAKAVEWVRLGRGSGGLLDSIELSEAESWVASPDAIELGYSTELLELLEASRERLQHEEKQWKELYEKAEHEHQIALARQLAAQAELIRNQQPHLLERSILLAVESIRRHPSLEADQALRHGLTLLPHCINILFHEDGVFALAFSPDGRYLATACRDHSARVWEISSKHQHTCLAHNDVVWDIKFSPDGKYLATASDDGSARIWDAINGLELFQLSHENEVHVVSFSPNGSYLATTSSDGTAKIWEVTSGRQLACIIHKDEVWDVTFSPDGKYLATASYDGTTKVCKVPTGRLVKRLSHTDKVTRVTFSPDSKYLATGSVDGIVRIWKVSSGHQTNYLIHTEEIRKIVFSHDGNYLVTVGGERLAKVWDITNQHLLAYLIHEDDYNSLIDVAFNPRLNYIVTGSEDGTVRSWIATQRSQPAHFAHKDIVWDVEYSPDGQFLATASRDHTAAIWSVTTGEQLLAMKHDASVRSSTFSPNGCYLATSSQNYVDLWDMSEKRHLIELELEGETIESVTFSQDSQYLLASSDSIATIWEVASGRQLHVLLYKKTVSSASISPDGRYVATASSDSTASIWEVASGRQLHILPHEHFTHSPIFSPDGHYIVTFSSDSTASIWEVASGGLFMSLEHKDMVITAAFSLDGIYLVTGDRNGDALLWEVTSGHQLYCLAHEEPVQDVIFSPDRQHLATNCRDGIVRVWEVTNGRQLTLFEHHDSIHAIAFSPDGRYLATGCSDGAARVWILQSEDLIAEACVRLTRNLTQEEWKQYLGDEAFRKTCS